VLQVKVHIPEVRQVALHVLEGGVHADSVGVQRAGGAEKPQPLLRLWVEANLRELCTGVIGALRRILGSGKDKASLRKLSPSSILLQ
jgi:hypothetical protein